MLTEYGLSRQADVLESLFYSAEVVLDGVSTPADLLKIRNSSSKMTVIIRLPGNSSGTITKCVVRDSFGRVVWEDNTVVFNPNRGIALGIPIEVAWKVGK
ncbi:hypothetical protein ABH14_10085 [Brevibacillus brevis]|uniref:hypothetical protein n=1 Tax=Brevibacillus brevis TaxID=1393 RepID=UPI0018FF45DE|nr:hypothetical protein [Brevibacillus brevis]MBH0330139.1 hypothetical protein [Brevibacillus brevis]